MLPYTSVNFALLRRRNGLHDGRMKTREQSVLSNAPIAFHVQQSKREKRATEWVDLLHHKKLLRTRSELFESKNMGSERCRRNEPENRMLLARM